MFLRAHVVVARPVEQVEVAMVAGARNWIPDIATEANGNGQKLLSELGFRVGKRRIRRRIKLDIGAARVASGLIYMPIRWRAASQAGIFPTLDGELEIADLGIDRTQLALSASYEPPLGFIGQLADRALLHRVAEVTVNDFLVRIGERIEKDR
jgi:hypothetical protein